MSNTISEPNFLIVWQNSEVVMTDANGAQGIKSTTGCHFDQPRHLGTGPFQTYQAQSQVTEKLAFWRFNCLSMAALLNTNSRDVVILEFSAR